MKLATLTAAAFGLVALAACETVQPETLGEVQSRALAACPDAIARSEAAGSYSYDLAECQCVAGRITVPLWSSETSSYSGDPMPLEDALTIADAIGTAPTMSQALARANDEISVPSSNSVNACFSKS